MPEAEEFLIDSVRRAVVALGRFWTQHHPQPLPPPAISLYEVRPRLELLIEAVLGRRVPVRVAQDPVPGPLFKRLLRGKVAPASSGVALPGNDGDSVYLPVSLPVDRLHGDVSASDEYAIVALQQALHCTRGTAAASRGLESKLVTDLYAIAEAIACGRSLVRLMPGWKAALNVLYGRVAGALAQRSADNALEAEVISLYAAFLQGQGTPLPTSIDTATSLAWARDKANSLTRQHAGARYVGLPRDVVMGEVLPREKLPVPIKDRGGPPACCPDVESVSPWHVELMRRPRVRASEEDQDASPGIWMVQTSEPQPHVEDPMGLNRMEDRELDDDLDGTADSFAELEEARLVHGPSPSKETFVSNDPPPRIEGTDAVSLQDEGIAYPEWDYQADAYLKDTVRVHVSPVAEGAAAWGDKTLARHKGLLQDIQRRFQSLRSGRHLLRRQIEGDDIDCEALVAEIAEARAGQARQGACYQRLCPAPQQVGLMLLIDASASTDALVGGAMRVIDVEKEAAFVAASAINMTGFEFAVLAFSGEGPKQVRVQELKGFDEDWGQIHRLRIAGIEPDRYTRLGAAVRHANALLSARAVTHRLLLLFSDGRPNDCDRYGSRYGAEDARRAILESRSARVSPYCLTIDREGGAYLPAMFSKNGYTVVREPQQLPVAFVAWLRNVAAKVR